MGYNLDLLQSARLPGRSGARGVVESARRARDALRAVPPARFLLYGSLPALAGLTAIVSLIVPMVLGPTRFGQYSLVETLFRYGLALDLGVGGLMDRRLPVLLAKAPPEEQRRFVSVTSWLRLYTAAAALTISASVLATLAACGVLAFNWTLGMLAVSAGVFSMLVNGPASVERARSNRRNFAILYAGVMLVLTAGRLFGIAIDGVPGCFGVMAVCYAGLAVAALSRMPPLGPRPLWPDAVAIWRDSLPLFLVFYVFAVYLTANRWLISSRMEPAAFGQFAFATGIITLLLGVVTGMSQLWYPKMANRRAAGDVIGVSRCVSRDLSLLAFVLSLATAVGIAAAPFMIGIVYPKFVASADLVRIVLPALPTLAVSGWLMPFLAVTGSRPWVDGVVIYPLALAILVVASEEGFQIAGTPGASWALVFSALPLLAMQIWRLHVARALTGRDALGLFAVVLSAVAVPALIGLCV